METLTFIEAAYNVANFFFYFAFGCFGQLTAILWQQYKFNKKIARSGGFKWSVWWSDNGIRAMATLCGIAASILFLEQITSMFAGIFVEGASGMKITTWSAFLAGFFIDKTMDALFNKKA